MFSPQQSRSLNRVIGRITHNPIFTSYTVSVPAISFLVVISFSTSARCQAPVKPLDAMYGVAPQPLTQAAPFDDFLLSLARSLEMNVAADVTQVVPEPPVQPYPGGNTTRLSFNSTMERDEVAKNLSVYQLIDVVDQRRLSMLRYKPRTLLFWKEPPSVPLAKQIVADRKESIKSLGDAKPPGATSWKAYWTRFLSEHGWDGKSKDVDIRVKLADLPPEAANGVLRQIWEERLRQDHAAFLSEENWAKAKLIRTQGYGLRGSADNFLGVKTFPAPPDPLPFGYSPSPVIVSIGALPARDADAQARNANPAFDASLVIDNYAFGDNSQPALEAKVDQPPAMNPGALRAEDLEQATALAVPVNLESKRISLQSLVEDLAKRTHIALTIAATSQKKAAAQMVVARFHEMKLGEAMSALSRLSGGQWHLQGTGYRLEIPQEDFLTHQLRQIGDPFFYSAGWTWQPGDYVLQQKSEFVKVLMANFDDAALGPQQPGRIRASEQDGIPVSSLSLPLQTQLKRFVEMIAARGVPGKQIEANSLFSRASEMVLRFRRESSPLEWEYMPEGEATIASSPFAGADLTTRSFGDPIFRFTVNSADGHLICPVFSSLGFEAR